MCARAFVTCCPITHCPQSHLAPAPCTADGGGRGFAPDCALRVGASREPSRAGTSFPLPLPNLYPASSSCVRSRVRYLLPHHTFALAPLAGAVEASPPAAPSAYEPPASPPSRCLFSFAPAQFLLPPSFSVRSRVRYLLPYHTLPPPLAPQTAAVEASPPTAPSESGPPASPPEQVPLFLCPCPISTPPPRGTMRPLRRALHSIRPCDDELAPLALTLVPLGGCHVVASVEARAVNVSLRRRVLLVATRRWHAVLCWIFLKEGPFRGL